LNSNSATASHINDEIYTINNLQQPIAFLFLQKPNKPFGINVEKHLYEVIKSYNNSPSFFSAI